MFRGPPYDAARFWTLLAAFFCRRGTRFFFFASNFGTFDFGDFTPTAAANFPATSPMVFAAVTRTPSGDSRVSFFFVMSWLF